MNDSSSDLTGKTLKTLSDPVSGASADNNAHISTGLELVDYAGIPQEEISVSGKILSPRNITEKVALQLAQQITNDKLRIHCYAPIDTPDQLIGDPVIVEQVLLRLADNALKHTKKGEIFIGCEVVDIYEEAQLAIVRFEVRDTGSGIKSDKLEGLIKPFDTYYKGEKSYAPKQHGLGLSIVDRLVKLMGGQVHMESAYKLGSRFGFEIPLGLNTMMNPTATTSISNHLDGRYVLIIASSESSQFILKNYIKAWHARPIIATDKTEAMLMLRNSLALNEPFYAILIDQDEPETNQDLIEAIRSKRRHDSAPIIVITSQKHSYQKITAAIPPPITSKQLYYLLNHDIRQVQTRTTMPSSFMPPESKVLLVEKNRLDATIANTILENLNIQIDHISDENQLIQQIIDNTYQLILISIPIAEKGFYNTRIIEMVRTWEEHTGQEKLPIIAIALYIPGIKPAEYLKPFGIDDYISKPIRKDEMLKVVRGYLPTEEKTGETMALTA